MESKWSRISYTSPVFSNSSREKHIRNSHIELYLKLNKKKQIDGFKETGSLIKRKNTNNIINKIKDKKELNACEYIYKEEQSNVKLIKKLYKVKDCSIFRYGIKESYEKIKYSFCKTCDKNLINPICEACIAKCHKGHRIKQIIEKGNIVCTCGENLHKIKSNDNENKINCLCYEWSYISKLNIYYKNSNKKCICYFCNMICENNNEKNKLIKLKKSQKDLKCENDDDFPICSCDNDEIHGDVKTLVDNILKFFKSSNQIKKLLHPIQIINMIFLSKKCFRYIFLQLEEFINKSKDSSKNYFENFFLMDITCTTIYYSFKLLKTLIEKATLAYYCDEIENYFSFNIYKSLILSLQKSNVDERSYWIFCRDYTFLFYKLYINKYTRYMIKLKIQDIENLLCIQRIILFDYKINNEDDFEESKEITTFLISQIRNIDIYQYNSIESIEYVKNVLLIFKKFSLCNLLSIDDMVNICIRIEVIFNFLDLTRKSCFKKNIEELIKIEFKIFSIVVKIMLSFIYNYNDKIIYNILNNKEKYPSSQFVIGEKISFLFKNNKLGDLINKIVIRVIAILVKYYNKKQTLEKYEQILLNAIKVLEYFLSTNDKYIKNILLSITYSKNKDFDVSQNEYYKKFINESNNIEKCYFDYLNFRITEKELLDLISKSLDHIIGEFTSNFDLEKDVDTLDLKFTKKKNTALILTRLFFKISKLFSIIFNENNSEEAIIKNEKTKNNNLIKKILTFYFIFIKSSPDNTLLVLSSYLLTEIIKLPIHYNILIFKLFNDCFKIISINNIQLSNIKYIINILYNYLEKMLSSCTISKLHFNENECLLYYFEILKIVIYDMKIYHTNNSILSYIKTIIINITKEFEIFKNYFKNKKKQTFSNFGNYNRTSQKDIDTINKIFIICIKLINDIFDFSSEKEREMISNVIDIENIMLALPNYYLDLSERTEFIRFVRKKLIDISYCEEKEDYYTSFIINKKDNLSHIINNDLISNFNYPTKLLSFIKDFYSLSKFVVLKEKIKNKIKKSKNENENENDLSILESNNFDDCSRILPNIIDNEKSQAVNEKGEKVCSMNKKITFTKMCIKSNFYLGKEKNFQFFRDNSNRKQSFSTKKALYFKSLAKISTKSLGNTSRRKSLFLDRTANDLRKIPIFKPTKKRSSVSFYFDKTNDSENSKPITNFMKESDNFIFNIDNRKEEKNCSFQFKKNSSKKQITKENKFEFKKKDSILIKNNNIYYYQYFDNDFYQIINSELDNYVYYTSEIMLNNKNNIALLKEYFENGLLIPIIYFFNRVFLFIDKYTGEEVMQICNLIEKSLNLKIYISKFSSKLWSEEIENLKIGSKNESNLLENENIIKKESYINYIYFTDEKYKKDTIQALKNLRKRNYSCLDYTFLYKIIEKEFLNLAINNRNLKIFDSFFSKKTEPNIINGDEEYYNSIILKFIQTEERKIENYDYKTDTEKKLRRIYFLFKYNKNYFLETIKELSLFNILNDICFEFHCNYMLLLVMFIIENHKENDSDLCNIKYYFLYILLLYMPNETQSSIIELLGGNDTEELGFIIPLFQKLFKKLILSIIDYHNPSDKIDYSSYYIAYNLITVFKFLCSQYNSFFQYHFIKSLSLNYSDKIPEKFMIKKIKGSSLNSTINECSDQSFLSSENSKKYDLIDYFSQDDSIILTLDKIDKTEIDFFDFFLCVLLKILLMTDNNEKRYELLNKHHLYLYDLFHIILDLLIEMIQGNKFITIKNTINQERSIIMKNKTKRENSNLSPKNLNLDKNIEIKNSFEIFIEHSIEVIFDIKMDMELLIGIKYKLLLFLMSIIEEQNCNKEIKIFIIRKLKINKILIEIGKLLKAYYIYEEEINNVVTLEKDVKIKEKLPKLKNKLILNFKDSINYDENKNIKLNRVFAEITTKTTSFGKLNNTLNTTDNSKLPLSKATITNNGKNELISKLNISHNYEETNEVYKTNNSNTLNQRIATDMLTTQNPFLKNKNQTFSYNNSIINTEEEFNKKIKELLFDDKLYNYFHDKFYKNNNLQDFTDNTLFQLSNLLYRCLKKIEIQEKNEEAIKMINYVKNSMENNKTSQFFHINLNQFIKEIINPNKLEFEHRITTLEKENKKGDKTENDIFNDENEDDLNKKNLIEQFYIIKFFESITSTVEVTTKEGLEYTVIFTKVPEFSFLSNESKSYFLSETNRGNGKTIKENLLQNVDYFIREINHYKKRKNSLIYLFANIPFNYFLKYSYYYILVFNLFLLITLEGDNQISNEYSKSARRYNESSIIDLQNKSLNKWGNYYKFVSICYVIINILLIFLWICFRFPLYYKIDKIKYIDEYKIKQSLKLKNKLYIIFFRTIFSRNYIFILLYEIIFSAIATIFNSVIFIVFGLLSVIQLNIILYSLIKIVKERSRELLLVGLLAIFSIYILSNFSFFFFKNDYEQYINDNEDNVCSSLLFCFLNAVDYGLRARGGIGDSGKKISFLRHKGHYIGRFILDVIFFMLIIIIMIDLLFGIITQSFLNIKNEYIQYLDDTKRCFICNISNDTLKKCKSCRINIHKKYVHNIWNYVEYIIRLKKNGTNFLNYIDAYVSKQIEKKSIAWLPTYSSFIKKCKKEDIKEEDIELEVLDEGKVQELNY